MHAGKTLRRPGATPLWTAFSRPNTCGVAPGLSAQNGDRGCPRAYRNVFNPKSRDDENPIAERRRS
jgi:hypothetical protein